MAFPRKTRLIILAPMLFIFPWSLFLLQAAAMQVGEDKIVAFVDNQSIYMSQLEQDPRVKKQRQKLEQTITENKQELLIRLIEERVLTQEAQKQNVEIKELKENILHPEEVTVSPQEVERWTTIFKRHSAQIREAEIKAHIKGLKTALAFEDYLSRVLMRYNIQVYAESTAKKVAVNTRNSPALGPDGAPVTLVVFSNYECFNCDFTEFVLDRVRELYPEKVRLVFKDHVPSVSREEPVAKLPPPTINQLQAAAAARCAYREGKGWEYRSLIYDRKSLDENSLKEYAKELGLKEFDSCFSRRDFTRIWPDVEEGKDLLGGLHLGFVINGGLLANQYLVETPMTFLPLKLVIDGLLAPVSETLKAEKFKKGITAEVDNEVITIAELESKGKDRVNALKSSFEKNLLPLKRIILEELITARKKEGSQIQYTTPELKPRNRK